MVYRSAMSRLSSHIREVMTQSPSKSGYRPQAGTAVFRYVHLKSTLHLTLQSGIINSEYRELEGVVS